MAEEAKRAAEREFNMMIRVGFPPAEDPDGKRMKTVTRGKLNARYLSELFDRDVAYLKDQFGVVVWPKDFLSECKPRPWKYFVVEKDAAREVVGESGCLGSGKWGGVC